MKSSYSKGFTLIELLVVIVIIAVFSLISLSSINRFTNEKQLQNESKKMMIVLELAKSKANAGDRTLCGIDNPLYTPEVSGFTFKVDESEKSYQIAPICIDSIPTPIVYSTSNDIEMETNSVTFFPNYGKVKCTCFIVHSVSLSKCRFVKVSENTVVDEGNCFSCDDCTTSKPDPNINCICT